MMEMGQNDGGGDTGGVQWECDIATFFPLMGWWWWWWWEGEGEGSRTPFVRH